MKRVVIVILDGLRSDQAFSLDLPGISRLRREGAAFTGHRAIFPSATRASSASVATGMFPARHGLHGNQMALAEGAGHRVHDVGKPDFFATLRAHAGRTLHAPTLAERVKPLGGGIVFANASPGAALAHDPDGHGHVYHRAVSQAPGRAPAADPLQVTLSPEGDAAMTRRFIDEVLGERRPASAVLWLGNPDDTQHDRPLGSPDALAAIAGADGQLAAVIAAVDALDPSGEEILLIAGSDHGHESVQAYVPVEAELIAAGFKAGPEDASIAIAPQGSGFLLYAADAEAARVAEIADWLETREWCGPVVREADLGTVGHAPGGGLRLAVGMRSTDAPNSFGIPGLTFAASRFETSGRTLGHGAHGGMGAFETRPFLVARGAGFPAGGVEAAATSLVDLAPTALAHLGLSAEGLDGAPLQHRFRDT